MQILNSKSDKRKKKEAWADTVRLFSSQQSQNINITQFFFTSKILQQNSSFHELWLESECVITRGEYTLKSLFAMRAMWRTHVNTAALLFPIQ